MLATGSMVFLPGGTGAACDGLVHCVGTTVWDGKMKAGVWLLGAGALVIAEHRKKQRLEDSYGLLERTRLLEQGDAALSFYAASRGLARE